MDRIDAQKMLIFLMAYKIVRTYQIPFPMIWMEKKRLLKKSSERNKFSCPRTIDLFSPFSVHTRELS